MPQARTAPAVQTPQPRVTYFADLSCLLCGSTVGTIEGDSPAIAPRSRFRVPGERTWTDIADWRRIRCNRCGGAALVEEVRPMVQYPEPAGEDAEDKPRRGRPPKWLVEQRRAQAEAMARDIAA